MIKRYVDELEYATFTCVNRDMQILFLLFFGTYTTFKSINAADYLLYARCDTNR